MVCLSFRPLGVRINTILAELSIIVAAAIQSVAFNSKNGNTVNELIKTSTKYVNIACLDLNIIKYSLLDKLTAYK